MSPAERSERAKKLLKSVGEFRHYIEANRAFIPNYGDRYRHGERIATSFAESTVNQVISKRMVKKQQMRWTERGAHLLLQVRTRVLNEDLRATFERWYPGLKTDIEPARAPPRSTRFGPVSEGPDVEVAAQVGLRGRGVRGDSPEGHRDVPIAPGGRSKPSAHACPGAGRDIRRRTGLSCRSDIRIHPDSGDWQEATGGVDRPANPSSRLLLRSLSLRMGPYGVGPSRAPARRSGYQQE